MPRDEARAPAITNDASGEFIRLYRTQKRRCDEENGVLRGIVKRAKGQGVNTKAMIAAVQTTKLDPDVVTTDLRDQLRYMTMMRIPVSQADLFSWLSDDDAAANQNDRDDDLWDAEDAGYQAGRNGVSIDDSPYDPGTEMQAHFEEFWHKGQAAIARQMGEDATPVTAQRGLEREAAQPRLAGPKRRSRQKAA